MTIITSYEELSELLTDFTFGDIGFEKINEDECFAEYYQNHPHRDDLYAIVNRTNFEAQVYTWNDDARQLDTKIGTFNIRRPDELLFLLTHGLNELRIEPQVLNRYKREIGFDQTDIIPSRPAEKY